MYGAYAVTEDLTLGANLLNNDRVTEVNEIYDDEGSADPTNPDVNPNYGLPTAWQTPRDVRFSVNYSF